jgi:DDE superfamily endonuclease/Helix-turn-helix of DDE superfamily endonuclease
VKFVRRNWRGSANSAESVRNFSCTPEKMGPDRKLLSRDEFLLTCMKLKLGLLNADLAKRFGISVSLTSSIFHSWLSAMHKTIGRYVYWASKEEIVASKPARYRHLPDLRAIIDCSEIFIETPKDPVLQTSTWSDYKHHNTLKFLIAVAPISSITFISSAYPGRHSDTQITRISGFLEKLDEYDHLMADKGIDIS